MELFEKVAMIAGIVMPLFNIPLVLRMIKRRSSHDLSLVWLVGVYFCILLMVPHGLQSTDIVLKSFTVVNALLFSSVVFTALFYRLKD